MCAGLGTLVILLIWIPLFHLYYQRHITLEVHHILCPLSMLLACVYLGVFLIRDDNLMQMCCVGVVNIFFFLLTVSIPHPVVVIGVWVILIFFMGIHAVPVSNSRMKM